MADVFRVYFPPTSPLLKNMWIFMFNVILCAVESSVMHRQNSVLCHCRAEFHQMLEDRSFSQWRTTSLEGRTSLEDAVSYTSVCIRVMELCMHVLCVLPTAWGGGGGEELA